MEPQEFKYKIDKELLKDFLLTPNEKVTKAQLLELNKVITVVFIKHFQKYLYHSDFHSELVQNVICEVLARKKNYDPSFSAYNYLYTLCRNEIGNAINRMTKETFVPDILPIFNASVTPTSFEVPAEIKRFIPYLVGTKEFTMIDLSFSDAVNLILFFLNNTNLRKRKIPDFIIKNKNSVELLYKTIFLLNGK